MLDVLGGFEHFPLVVELNTRQLNFKLVQYLVHFHALINFPLEFLDLNPDLRNVLLLVSQLINRFRLSINFRGDLLKLSRDLMSRVLSFLLNKFDLLLNNLGELASVVEPDLATVDLEHRHVHCFWDQLFYLLLLF